MQPTIPSGSGRSPRSVVRRGRIPRFTATLTPPLAAARESPSVLALNPPRPPMVRPRDQSSPPTAIRRSSPTAVGTAIMSASTATETPPNELRVAVVRATPARTWRDRVTGPPSPDGRSTSRTFRTVTPARINPNAAMAPKSKSPSVSPPPLTILNVEASTRWSPIDWPTVAPNWETSTDRRASVPTSCRPAFDAPVESGGRISLTVIR